MPNWLWKGENKSLSLTRDVNFDTQSSDISAEEIRENVPVLDGLRKETTFACFYRSLVILANDDFGAWLFRPITISAPTILAHNSNIPELWFIFYFYFYFVTPNNQLLTITGRRCREQLENDEKWVKLRHIWMKMKMMFKRPTFTKCC